MLPQCRLLSRSTAWTGLRRSTCSRRTYRTYADAVAALNDLQSNHDVVRRFRQSGQGMNQDAIPEMLDWLHKAGYKQSDLRAFNAIHIAGTKGKGSTSVFVASILKQYRRNGLVGDTGLYTSPHLRFVRERIVINGKPLSEDAFAEDFFEVFDRFEASARRDGKPTDASSKPAYFRFLTIMAFHSYIKARTPTAVIECGMGGEYDSTNVITHPTVTAITSLGIEHKEALGDTIESIAWHKGGIMKPGALALTVAQPAAAMAVLRSRAKAKGVTLKTVDVHPEIDSGFIKLGLGGSFQKLNASLAVEIAAEHLERLGHPRVPTNKLSPEFMKGLATARLNGRCDIRHEIGLTWFLDGAHTTESIQAAAEWFREASAEPTEETGSPPRILIFNQQNRDDADQLLATLRRSLSDSGSASSMFTHVIFCTNVTFEDLGYRPDLKSLNSDEEAVRSLKVQNAFVGQWRELDRAGSDNPSAWSAISVCHTIEEAIAAARVLAAISEKKATAKVLVTGSMHLVGGTMEVLETQLYGTPRDPVKGGNDDSMV